MARVPLATNATGRAGCRSLQQHRSTSSCYSSKQKAVNRRRCTLNCHASVIWRQLEGTKAWVAHPRAARVNGVIHFVGGAFAGAAPQLLYNGFLETLADAGYTTIATPYAVTFRHDQCAKAVRRSFLDSVTELRASGRSYLAPKAAPLFGVGHSNGALLHLLIGSLEPGATQANVIISYNNLQVSDAIPIPGLLENLQPTVQAARSMSSSEDINNDGTSNSGRRSPGLPLPLPLPTSEQVLAAAAASLPAFLLPAEQQLLAGAAPALDQLASIVNEVGDGLTDFRPSPEESRAIIAAGYSCPSTLLVQFENDNFDETPEMQQILLQRLNNAGANGNSSGSRETTVTEGSSAPAVLAAAGGGMSIPAAAAAADLNAWSSIDEDIDVNRVLAQLNLLQQRQQLPGQQQQQPDLQALLLPGSHVTPCGGQVRQDSGLLRSAQPDSRELKNLSRQVLGWLEERRKNGRAVAPVAAAPGRL